MANPQSPTVPAVKTVAQTAAPTVQEKSVTTTATPAKTYTAEEVAALLAEASAEKSALEQELAVTKAKLPANDFITLRGGSPTFSVVVEGKRCMFVNFLFVTRDPALAANIVALYPNITKVNADEQVPAHMPESSAVI